MGVSSNTLIHLTSEKASLLGILGELSFRVYYCKECVEGQGRVFTAAFPMVSFSDLPLSELQYHMSLYGSYGIGLKKTWARRNGLNPVLYFDVHSNLAPHMHYAFGLIHKLLQEGYLDKRFANITYTIYGYSKNYEGKLVTRKTTIENYRFSDEREWRFVPLEQNLGEVPFYVGSEVYETDDQRNAVNAKIDHLRLKFDVDDISYIFVDSEDDIEEVLDILKASSAGKLTYESDRLISKIISADQIKHDF